MHTFTFCIDFKLPAYPFVEGQKSRN